MQEINNRPLVNRVKQSGLTTLNLEDFLPSDELAFFDLKEFLFKELILKEKDFRTALKTWDWAQYTDKVLLVHCSSAAIIPRWAYMLVAALAEPFAKDLFFGTSGQYYSYVLQQAIAQKDWSVYTDQRLVIKGCGDERISDAAYLAITKHLRPFAKSIMYGEPCSTVPVYKRKM